MIRVLELFAGIGACSKALERLGIEHEIIDAVEIDKYAIKSFNAIHGTNFEPQDITKWEKDIECDLIMHGSPCQDFSVAGKQAGGDKDSGTRSSLMYETLRIVEKLRPKYVVWENVKNLLSNKHRHNFDAYIKAMEELGYKSFYKVLNAKDYGVPQNRERVFTVSIRKERLIYDDYNSSVRKDQDTIGTLTTNCGAQAPRNGWKIIENKISFAFPEPIPIEKKLKDVLEDNVDEKYYLSQEKADKLKFSDVSKTIRSGGRGSVDKHSWDIVKVGDLDIKGQPKIIDDTYGYETKAREYIDVGPTLRSGRQGLKVAIKTANQKGYDLAQDGDGVDLAYPNSKTRRGRVGHGVAKTLACADTMGVLTTRGKDVASTIRASIYKQGSRNIEENIKNGRGYEGVVKGFRIRKLTPKECWRLMGFDDSDFEKAKASGVSSTQLYKQAGNSIVVNVLEAILKNLLKENK